MSNFKYSPLANPSRDIRLISLQRTRRSLISRIRRTSLRDEQNIYCELSVVPLDKAPPYVALSYTWGDPKDTLPIYVNNTLMQVTRNLHSALLHLGLDSGKILWVDAVCIDQQNNMEKSEQVQLMREIYQRAMHVTVWLGPADDTSDRVMDYLNILGEEALLCNMSGLSQQIRQKWVELFIKPVQIRDKGTPSGGGHTVLIAERSYEQVGTYSVPLRRICDLYYKLSNRHDASMCFPLEGMAALFKRGWWSRIWILQEFAVAKSVGFVCDLYQADLSTGKKKLSRARCTAALDAFTIFRSVVTGLTYTADRRLTDYEEAIGMANFDPRPNKVLGIGVVLKELPLNLLALLRLTCVESPGLGTFRVHRMESTLPQDKIYGLLGLASDKDVLGIVPDYRLPCHEVYEATTRALLREDHVSVLSLCQLPHKVPNLPSWVPDFSMPLTLHLQSAPRSYSPLLLPQYSASGESQPRIEFSRTIKNEPILGLYGVVVDKVRAIGKTYNEIADGGGNIIDWAQEWIRVLLGLSMLPVEGGGKNHNRDEHHLCVFRTSTADAASDKNGNESRANTEGLKAAAMLQWIGADEDTLRAHDRETFAAVGGFKYVGMMSTRARGRKPFVTSQGHLGLGPMALKEGDAVAVFLGFQVPFVIAEREDGTYQLVGDTYLDDFMDGEALEGNPRIESIQLA
ncbi:heterokaryon incompatibility protein [Rutstroemia sp. NJR-2017a WRK4]|nr:heterokaryon incompatibility protein [Rutstroemia sp. NJR-2017a WRK4]